MLVLAYSQAIGQKIYTCRAADGKTITSDRPIVECKNLPQRELNSDGSVNRIVPPTLTQEERAALEQKERDADAERNAFNEAVRRDRNLLNRFPNEARHKLAREKAIEDVQIALRSYEQRLVLLRKEKKPLLDEAEFYPKDKLPLKVKLALDANDASTKAHEQLIVDRQAELGRVNAIYDIELARLRKLWAGAQPGSLPPSPQVAPAASTTAAAPAVTKNPAR